LAAGLTEWIRDLPGFRALPGRWQPPARFAAALICKRHCAPSTRLVGWCLGWGAARLGGCRLDRMGWGRPGARRVSARAWSGTATRGPDGSQRLGWGVVDLSSAVGCRVGGRGVFGGGVRLVLGGLRGVASLCGLYRLVRVPPIVLSHPGPLPRSLCYARLRHEARGKVQGPRRRR
jgi:hypothetical protein